MGTPQPTKWHDGREVAMRSLRGGDSVRCSLEFRVDVRRCATATTTSYEKWASGPCCCSYLLDLPAALLRDRKSVV